MKSQSIERLPRGQVLTKKWPVLTYCETPRFDPATWTFRCFGSVKQPVTWTWPEFLALPRIQSTSDVHCVTRWSRFDNRWEGVAVSEIFRRSEILPGAQAVMVHADPDYTTNLLLDDLRGEDALLALKHDGADLPVEHGGPCRLVVPKLYFWKSAKWVRGFVPGPQRSGILGGKRLPSPRRPMEGRALRCPGNRRNAEDAFRIRPAPSLLEVIPARSTNSASNSL